MKNAIFYIGICLASFSAAAQQVPRTVVAEHFTNTYCSICATNNPALLANLTSFPQVMHIAYHPSAPYASCPLSMHNVSENNARTNYYGVFGSTPRLVVSGSVLTPPFTSPTIYSSQLATTTSFAMSTRLTLKGTDSITIRTAISKVDTSSLTSLELYGAAVEDTLFFTAANGETKHVDVFRKSFWGTTSLSITAPTSVGDSTVYEKTVARNTTWNINRMYAIAILQRADKNIVQASKSATISGAASGVDELRSTITVSVYPNPATTRLSIEGYADVKSVVITDITGRTVKQVAIDKSSNSIDISSLESGSYFMRPGDDTAGRQVRFVK